MSGDETLLQAWERRVAAFEVYNALPHSDVPGEVYTPEEAAQWAIIDEAEETIRATLPTGPAGVAVHLWTALAHNMTNRVDEAAVLSCDLDYFIRRDPELDFIDRLLLAALRGVTSLAQQR